ncbi:TetR/AcrR family transcriptional regulator [Spirillospora sp. CA-253888]
MSGSPRPLGRRGHAVARAVLDAALEELAERGLDDATVAGVAERAGVHKTSIYRRFPTRENLFTEALIVASEARVPVPDTGTLRGDLVAALRLVCDAADAPLGLALLRTGTLAGDPAYDAERRRFWSERMESFAQIFRRAIDREEVDASVDVPLALEMLVAPVHSRLLVTGFPLEADLPERVADLLLRGLPTTPGPSKEPP